MRWFRDARILLLVLAFVLTPLGYAGEQFAGKVVGISDGDTLSVMRDGKAVKVRLYGIDTPEKGQAFSTIARQFTSELAYNQTVTVIVTSMLYPRGSGGNKKSLRWF